MSKKMIDISRTGWAADGGFCYTDSANGSQPLLNNSWGLLIFDRKNKKIVSTALFHNRNWLKYISPPFEAKYPHLLPA